MLRWTASACVATLIVAATVGCNDKVVTQGPLPEVKDPAALAPLPPLVKPPLVPEAREYDAPAATVEGFLAALRGGDQVQVKHMLTAKAREEAARKGFQIRPMGSATATYQVGEVRELPDEQGHPAAHVHSTWIDRDEAGKEYSFQVAWILRSESGHWRIAGLAAEIPGTKEPALMNFENLDELEATRRHAEARLAEQPAREIR